MTPDPGRVLADLRTSLARRLGEQSVDWIRDDEPLAAAGIDSVDVISVVAAVQRAYGASLPDELVVSSDVSLARLAAALAPPPTSP